MRASAIEFRLRIVIQIAIVLLGFWAPWIQSLDLSRRVSLLEWLALEMTRAGLLSFVTAAPVVITLGAVAAGIAAVLRVWGTAYMGYGTVHDGKMVAGPEGQAGHVMAGGPYRYVRNPLYLGTWFMIAAIALLMSPTGALVAMVLETILLLRLILGEEAFLAGTLGENYREYLRVVPRLAPRLRSNLAHSGSKPHWRTAFLSEINPIGVFITLAFLSWKYDNELMLKAILVSFGVSLVVRAFAGGGAGSKTAEA